jgi:saccharopine dehydrogenase-like NADP-dependent oxidoreductase
MKKVAIFGSGMMPPAIIDYYTHKYPCEMIVATIDLPQAKKLVGDNPLCQIMEWSADAQNSIDRITQQVDFVAGMVPEQVIPSVARSCIITKTPMVYTAYEESSVRALSEEAKDKGILILSEVGEDPGLDHLCTVKLLEEIRQQGGIVTKIMQWGAGLPDHADNNNPMGYKFSWSPPRLYEALQAKVSYIVNGKEVQHKNGEQYRHFKLVETKWGTFESVAHRSVGRYLVPYQLEHDISFFRGLLRHYGYCNTINHYLALGLLNSKVVFDYNSLTCRQVTASLINSTPDNIEAKIAAYLDVKIHDDIIYRLRWLGLFDDAPVPITLGTRVEYLLSLQKRKMMYAPNESDITLIQVRIEVEYPNQEKEIKEARLRVPGIPGGFSAMTRAVGYSVGIAGKHIMEGNIENTGCFMLPEIPKLCRLLRSEMATYGFEFNYKTIKLL